MLDFIEQETDDTAELLAPLCIKRECGNRAVYKGLCQHHYSLKRYVSSPSVADETTQAYDGKVSQDPEFLYIGPKSNALYRPIATKWDDDIAKNHHVLSLDNSVWQSYDNNVIRLCFACLDSYAVDGSIYCSPCNVKRNRRIRDCKDKYSNTYVFPKSNRKHRDNASEHWK